VTLFGGAGFLWIGILAVALVAAPTLASAQGVAPPDLPGASDETDTPDSAGAEEGDLIAAPAAEESQIPALIDETAADTEDVASARTRINGSFGIALRGYFDEAPYPEQEIDHFYAYGFGKLNFEHALTENDKLQAELYGRLTAQGSASLFDTRRLYYLHTAGTWDFLLGVNTVAWGVTESRHLIDIINQRDTGGNLDDDEDRLGQPMANLNVISPNLGTLSLFALFGFRELDFPEPEDRLRDVFVVSEGSAQFGGDDWEKEVNFAARYTNSFNVFGGGLDVGLSYFHGLNREPALVLTAAGVTPQYNLINQVGLESVYAYEDLQLKFEGLSRWESGEQFFASVSGLEYTFHDVFGGMADLGLLAEYLYDGRSADLPPTPFEDDVFGGVRLTFNNVGSTRILAGVITDVEDQNTYSSLEFEHRLRDDVLLTVDARTFLDIPSTDPFAYLTTESFVEVGFEKFF
jgi:hypothetical protein